ncbi:MAG: twin-arginine translocation signal domain-containing protein [Myxococcota bacterium]
MDRRRFLGGMSAGAAAAVTGACALRPEQSDSRGPSRPGRTTHSKADGIVRVGGAELTLLIEGDNPSMSQAAYEGWVEKSAQMIADYYGGTLPVPSLEITLKTAGRGSVGYGHHKQGRWITIYCGRRTKQSSLDGDWVMVHEMLHATFPDLPDRHRWMQEGLSTYLEKIVRAQSGDVDEENVWRRLSKSMHHGRPRAGDRGLDRTHTWGRTYWGGALFWMVADVELRRATNNRKGLRDALLHIADQGGNARKVWPTRKVCEEADAGTDTTIVSDLYDAMALAPGDIDLDRLWDELGVVRADDGSVSFDDRAPLAAVRRAITAA